VLTLQLAQFSLGVFEPTLFLRQLAIQQRDVPLTFAQYISGAWDINKCRIAKLRTVRAHCHEEVRLLGNGVARIDPHLDGVAGFVRTKRHTLHVVFEVERHVREHLAQFVAEFGEFEFVHMKWILPLRAARFSVVTFVGCGDNKLAVGRQRAASFLQEFAPIRQVLDHFESHDEIEAGIGEGQRAAGRLFENKVGRLIVGARKFDGIGGAIYPHHFLRGARQLG
jgi:hypothetical protein